MRVIGRSQDPAHTAPTPDPEDEQGAGKGRPTPKRKVSEAANKRPLVVDDRKAAQRTAREKGRSQRNLEYQAMITGDERHMPAKDAGPVKRFVRDYVDSRFSLGAFFLPVAIAFLLVSFAAQFLGTWPFIILVGLLYLYVVAVIVDSVFLWFRLKKTLVARFGPGSERGNLMYGTLRATQLPRTRLPKPRVTRGGVPVKPKAPKAK